jgi:hypothetical protein
MCAIFRYEPDSEYSLYSCQRKLYRTTLYSPLIASHLSRIQSISCHDLLVLFVQWALGVLDVETRQWQDDVRKCIVVKILGGQHLDLDAGCCGPAAVRVATVA